MSEDGTLRSLEPAPPESSTDGSPAEEVGEGLWPRRWARPGQPGSPAAAGAGTPLSPWGGLSQTLPFLLVVGLALGLQTPHPSALSEAGWPLP